MSGDQTSYDGPERRREAHLTDAQIESIAEKAATKAVKKMTDDAYMAIGKSITSKFFAAVGVITIVVIVFFKTGKLPTP